MQDAREIQNANCKMKKIKDSGRRIHDPREK